MSSFAVATVAIWLVVVVAAWFQRRGFVLPVAIIGGVHALLSSSAAARLGWPLPLLIALQLAAFSPLVRLPGRGLRPRLFHAVVSVPGAWWIAGSFVGLP